jgi:hypothetical protein
VRAPLFPPLHGVSPPPRNTRAELAGAAFERTYFDHAPVMRRVATRRFGIPGAEAEALVHDIFATWLANPAVVRGGGFMNQESPLLLFLIGLSALPEVAGPPVDRSKLSTKNGKPIYEQVGEGICG